MKSLVAIRLSLLISLCAIGLSAQTAHAQASGEVLIIHAQESAGEIDPALREITALQRAPFNSYRSMRILSRPALSLSVGASTSVTLPNGRQLQVTLQGITENGRYELSVSISRPDGPDYLREARIVAAPGDPFFVAGQSHNDGILLIGIRLGSRS